MTTKPAKLMPDGLLNLATGVGIKPTWLNQRLQPLAIRVPYWLALAHGARSSLGFPLELQHIATDHGSQAVEAASLSCEVSSPRYLV